jgi:hypothetical protein
VLLVFVVLVVATAVGVYVSLSSVPRKTEVAAERPPSEVPGPTPSSAPHTRHYSRPALAPNGEPWPSISDYVQNYERLNNEGLSSVTVDNKENNFDALVKLFDRELAKPSQARVFFLRAHEEFKLSEIRPGTYDIRYQDLDSGVISRSEPFTLQEIQLSDRTQYSEVRLTLYTVVAGNTRFQIIDENEF